MLRHALFAGSKFYLVGTLFDKFFKIFPVVSLSVIKKKKKKY